MQFIAALPVGDIKVGSVFYADGFGYAVVVLLTGKRMGKAYTAYNRPLVLMSNEEETEFKVYPQGAKEDGSNVSEAAHVNEVYIGDIRYNDTDDECVYGADGGIIGVLVSDGVNELILKDCEVVYKNVTRVGKVELGAVCERLEFTETDKVLSMDIEENWRDILGDDALVKLIKMLVDGLVTSLHTSQLAREERKWEDAVVDFRTNQKPLRVEGKMFKPKASRFVCGFERDGVRNLLFVKKITNVIYRVTQNISQAGEPYVVEECNDDILRGDLQKAVRDNLMPMAAYDYLFGKSSERTVQVSGQIPVELQERMKWGGYSLPQVIQAGIQALEDVEYARDYKAIKSLPNVIKGRVATAPASQLLRAILLREDV